VAEKAAGRMDPVSATTLPAFSAAGFSASAVFQSVSVPWVTRTWVWAAPATAATIASRSPSVSSSESLRQISLNATRWTHLTSRRRPLSTGAAQTKSLASEL
jgi:hypothetical protein